MKQIIIFSILALLLSKCNTPSRNDATDMATAVQLPRVLFITTGISNEDAQMAQGVVVAVQAFNKMGATVRLEPRDILYNFEELRKYNIIILSSFPAYHDADRKYSLTYMSDEELHNLSKFVEQGGVMVSGDNIGRNFPDGTDRILEYGQLNTKNWPLSKCYGLSLKEKNMVSYDLEGELINFPKWHISLSSLVEKDAGLWTLVPDSILSKDLEILGYWKNGQDSLPAITKNKFKKGTALLMSSSSFLHPANDGGYWSVKEIEDFYQYIIETYNKSNGLNMVLNPWPNAHKYAFSVSFNSEGEIGQYERIFRLLDNEGIQPTIFVNGLVAENIQSLLLSTSYELESSGYAYNNYAGLKYPLSLNDILRNENKWNIDFHGFRFPYTKPGYWGLLTLDKYNYLFESSIGANNIDFIHGSVFPYNVVISNDKFFKSTNLLEIAPTYHDDYYFLKAVKQDNEVNARQLEKSNMIYSKYLHNFWEFAVKPYQGLMVYLGHPQYVGYSDSTITSLSKLIRQVKQDNTWITSLSDVANFRKELGQARFYVDNANNKRQTVKVVLPDGIKISDVCLNFTGQLKQVSAKDGKVDLIENPDGFQIIFDAYNGQTLTLEY